RVPEPHSSPTGGTRPAMNVRFHRLAVAEIDHEVDYYESRQTGLGEELEDEIDTVLSMIRRFPEAASQLGFLICPLHTCAASFNRGCTAELREQYPANAPDSSRHQSGMVSPAECNDVSAIFVRKRLRLQRKIRSLKMRTCKGWR
ncbi:MAG TPA: hypothetical protein VF483_08840, partial [Gemmatimonadaceae bacterium]